MTSLFWKKNQVKNSDKLSEYLTGDALLSKLKKKFDHNVWMSLLSGSRRRTEAAGPVLYGLDSGIRIISLSAAVKASFTSARTNLSKYRESPSHLGHLPLTCWRDTAMLDRILLVDSLRSSFTSSVCLATWAWQWALMPLTILSPMNMMTMAVMTYGIMIVIYVCSLAAASDGGHVWLIVLYQA